jgi:hypothetical protein
MTEKVLQIYLPNKMANKMIASITLLASRLDIILTQFVSFGSSLAFLLGFWQYINLKKGFFVDFILTAVTVVGVKLILAVPFSHFPL